MKLQIIAFRYLTIEGLERVSKNWAGRNASAVMRDAFVEMLKQEPWETTQESSPLPEVAVYLHSGDQATQSSLQNNLGDVIPAIATLQEIDAIKVHCVKIAKNPLEVRRVLIFECNLKQTDEDATVIPKTNSKFRSTTTSPPLIRSSAHPATTYLNTGRTFGLSSGHQTTTTE